MNKKRYNHGYRIYKTYTIDEIFVALDNNKLPDKVLYGNKDYKDSLSRIKIIKQLIERDGVQCLECGETSTLFALGKDNGGYWHLDLYSIKSDEFYMFTIDHIYPKSKGGENGIDNYQLLCKICNEDKADVVIGSKPIAKKSKKGYKDKYENYISDKLQALQQQTKGVFTKIKNQEILCIKKKKGFTIGNIYPVINIISKTDLEFNTTYKFHTINDSGIKTLTKFDFFIVKRDDKRYKKYSEY